jgi:hypothetical protein
MPLKRRVCGLERLRTGAITRNFCQLLLMEEQMSVGVFCRLPQSVEKLNQPRLHPIIGARRTRGVSELHPGPRPTAQEGRMTGSAGRRSRR